MGFVIFGSCFFGEMGERGNFLEDDIFVVIVGVYGVEFILVE